MKNRFHSTFFTGVYIPEAQLYQFSVPALTKILHGRILAHRPISLLRPARKFPILDVKGFSPPHLLCTNTPEAT